MKSNTRWLQSKISQWRLVLHYS